MKPKNPLTPEQRAYPSPESPKLFEDRREAEALAKQLSNGLTAKFAVTPDDTGKWYIYWTTQ